MNTFARVLFAVLVVSSVVYVNGDGWFIESDYSDTACTTPSWLYISSVLADRNQTTDCFPATQGSIQGECDFTKSPISYYATKFTDAECATPSVVAAVSSSYCLSGSSASSILSCGISSQRKITNVHASGLVLVAGYSYFSSSKCSKSTFYHAELAPIAACPKTYPPLDRTPNKCYAARNGGQNWVCGPLKDVLAEINFTI